MQRLQAKLREEGLPIPAGLLHLLQHHGTSRKEVYRALYGLLVYGGKLEKPGTTLVYPEEIRRVVRERFPEDGAGAYDVQYESKGRQVTLREMAEQQWRAPPLCVQTEIFKTLLVQYVT